MPKIKLGDIVQLKIGSPKMTVDAIKDEITCQWFVGEKLESEEFPKRSLTLDEGNTRRRELQNQIFQAYASMGYSCDKKKRRPKLELDDTVQLNSGGPKMFIREIYKGKMKCQWFAKEVLKSGMFSSHSVSLYTEPKEMNEHDKELAKKIADILVQNDLLIG